MENRFHNGSDAVNAGDGLSKVAFADDGFMDGIGLGVGNDGLTGAEQCEVRCRRADLDSAGDVGSDGVDVLADLNAHCIDGAGLGAEGHYQVVLFGKCILIGRLRGSFGLSCGRLLGACRLAASGEERQHHAYTKNYC